ncbi:MAG: hypothetical protein ACK5LT_09820, partial [Lachnospirales bacterium]
PKRVENFIEMISKIKNRHYDIVAATSNDECVKKSDIVCTCTTSSSPVFNGESVQEGTHINAIGSFTSFMQEIDEVTVKKANKIVTEHIEGLWEAAGDIIIPFENGLVDKSIITGTIGEAVVGKIKLRENDQEITLNESVGSGVLDIGLAIHLYKLINN